ncbi:MAG: Trm112 family protein [bacterium]
MSLDQRLLDILACPKCKGSLDYRRTDLKLVCPACKLAYPVRDGIPVMLEAEAERIDS